MLIDNKSFCVKAGENSATHQPFMGNIQHHIAPPSTPVGDNSLTAMEFKKVTEALSGLTDCIAHLQAHVKTLGTGCPANIIGAKAQNRRMTRSEGRRLRAQGLFEFHRALYYHIHHELRLNPLDPVTDWPSTDSQYMTCTNGSEEQLFIDWNARGLTRVLVGHVKILSDKFIATYQRDVRSPLQVSISRRKVELTCQAHLLYLKRRYVREIRNMAASTTAVDGCSESGTDVVEGVPPESPSHSQRRTRSSVRAMSVDSVSFLTPEADPDADALLEACDRHFGSVLEAIYWTLKPLLQSSAGQAMDFNANNLSSPGFLIRFLSQRARLDTLGCGRRVVEDHVIHGLRFLRFLLKRDNILLNLDSNYFSMDWLQALLTMAPSLGEPEIARLFVTGYAHPQQCDEPRLQVPCTQPFAGMFSNAIHQLPFEAAQHHSGNLQGYLTDLAPGTILPHLYMCKCPQGSPQGGPKRSDACTDLPSVLIFHLGPPSSQSPHTDQVWDFTHIVTIDNGGEDHFDYELIALICVPMDGSARHQVFIHANTSEYEELHYHGGAIPILKQDDVTGILDARSCDWRPVSAFYRLSGGKEQHKRFHLNADLELEAGDTGFNSSDDSDG